MLRHLCPARRKTVKKIEKSLVPKWALKRHYIIKMGVVSHRHEGHKEPFGSINSFVNLVPCARKMGAENVFLASHFPATF